MNINFESDIVEINDDGFYISGTDIPVYQVLSDLANGTSLTDIAEEYDIEENSIAQLIIDISEIFR